MLQCSISVDRMTNGIAAQQTGDVTTNQGVLMSRSRLWGLIIGSMGVVYGDIGTSPLYAFRVAVTTATGETGPTSGIVYGILSLILWSLIVIVTLKYVVILLRADNNGEGGTLTLMALAQRALDRVPSGCRCSASSGRRCSTATRSSPRRSRCSRRSKVSTSTIPTSARS